MFNMFEFFCLYYFSMHYTTIVVHYTLYILLNLHKIICANNSKKNQQYAKYTNTHKTCKNMLIKLIITIVIKLIFISISIFFDVAKKTCKYMNLRVLIVVFNMYLKNIS
jgi:hypothetical protein